MNTELEPKVQVTKEEKSESTTSTKPNDGDIEMKSNDNKTKNKNVENSTKSQTTEKTEKETVKPKKPKVREAFTQTASNITFTLYVKNLTQDDVSVCYDTKRIKVELKLKDGTIYKRIVELSGEIIKDKCSFNMNKYKVNVILTKKTLGNWKVYEEIIDNGKDEKITAPWTTKKDWNKVDKYAAEELEKEKPEGDEALQSLFSKIYGDADDDQKRAMVKSFQTSGGTVLSTNWGDVKDKDYEGKDKVLPTGQNVQNWEY